MIKGFNNPKSSAPVVWSCHAGIILLLLVAGLIPSCRHKKLETIKVSLVSLPAPSPEASAVSPAPEPAPPTPAPPPPEPVRQPPLPQPPPEPVPQPRPLQKAVTQKKPEPPKPRLRTPEEIRRSAKLEKPTQATPTPSPVNSSDIERKLTQTVRNVSASYSTPTTGSVSADSANRYLSAISAILRSRWQQPSASQLAGQRPVVVVALTIARDGSIGVAKISQASGNTAMDASVRSLLNGIDRLPPPSRYGIQAATFSVDIAFETS